jgi:polysaccharide biosynthesis/export protein
MCLSRIALLATTLAGAVMLSGAAQSQTLQPQAQTPQPQPAGQPQTQAPAQPEGLRAVANGRPEPRNPAPAPVAAAAPTAKAAPDYRLVAGDKLRIEVYKDAHLSQSLQVRPDGKITLPLVGDLVAAGRTPIELRNQIANALKEYVANPAVTVIVTEVVEPVVYVMGEVNQPGAVPLRGPMTVLQALAVAGGFKEFANPNGIKILRPSGSPDQMETVEFSYKRAVRSDDPVVYLRAGDTVVVP